MSNIIDLLDNHKILIPKVQRDYAYSRLSERENVNNFIDVIFDVLGDRKDSLRLNYIYGVPKEDGWVVLIDGQQRTTTLFLIRLFLSVNAGGTGEKGGGLVYATRTTSKDFCVFLAEHSSVLIKQPNIDFETRLKNEKAFFKKWRNDPTVLSMITVLDMVDKKCEGFTRENYEQHLRNLEKITFEFILLEGFRREESLYTAMNGRGKQLTPFEMIKPQLSALLSCVDAEIENTINNGWVPQFWKYASDLPEASFDSVAENHDMYLYNYFSYVATMLWYENNVVAKNQKAPPLKTILHWLENLEEPAKSKCCELLLFAINSFPVWSRVNFSEHLSWNFVHDSANPEKTNIFWGNKEYAFLMNICKNDSSNDLLEKSLFWAFVIYRYKESRAALEGKTLKDYFVLMRDVYAASWDSQTPTAITKNPSEHLVASGIMAFRKIVDGIDAPGYENQAKTFRAENESKYWILNNHSTRGCSDNLAEVIQQEDGYSDTHAQTLAKNLDFLVQNCEKKQIQNMIALSKVGYDYFINAINAVDRLYLPCTRYMLQSLFSMRSWAKNSWYQSFVKTLAENELEGGSVDYCESDWQWYVDRYTKDFVLPDSLAAFDFSYSSDTDPVPVFWSANGVYGTKATLRQTVSPFILAAYRAKYSENTKVKECQQFVEENKAALNMGPAGLQFTLGEQIHELTSGKDIVEQIKERIN